jgi:hypothetical protein
MPARSNLLADLLFGAHHYCMECSNRFSPFWMGVF